MLQKTIIKTPQIYHLIQEINLYLPQNIELSDFFFKYVSSVKHEEIIMPNDGLAIISKKDLGFSSKILD